MNPSSNPNEKLEQWAHQTLRDLPARQAPRSLELRVLAEIERRASLHWWQRSFRHWPMAARTVFIFLCAGLAQLALMAGSWIMDGVAPAHFKAIFAEPYAWLESATALMNAVSGFIDIMLRNIPPLWVYGGLVIFAALYATLFGLGAAAYKALHARE